MSYEYSENKGEVCTFTGWHSADGKEAQRQKGTGTCADL